MRISFVCPSAPAPMGGVTVLYEFANGLTRRGHEVHIAHEAFWGRPGVSSLEELPWMRFEEGVRHHFGTVGRSLPDADVIFGTGAPDRLGLPVLVIQGLDMFPEAIEREVFRTPCLKVCVATWLLAVGDRYGVPREQLVHVPVGIHHELFTVRRPLRERGPVVGMLYNSHPAKGWVLGREALETAKRRRPELEVLLFGTEAPDTALPAWMTYVGAVAPADVADRVYNRCRAFLQSSHYEGFGFTALEAMACGAVLVTTDNGGSRDYAAHGETALVVPPGDAGALAAALVSLLADETEQVRLSTAGRDVARRFDWDASAASLEAHLEAYLADPTSFGRPADPRAPDHTR